MFSKKRSIFEVLIVGIGSSLFTLGLFGAGISIILIGTLIQFMVEKK